METALPLKNSPREPSPVAQPMACQALVTSDQKVSGSTPDGCAKETQALIWPNCF